MKYCNIFLLLLLSTGAFSQTKYDKDFEEFWTDVNENYAYFDQQNLHWHIVKEIYAPQVEEISNDAEFIRLLEKVTNEFFNGHVSLDTNLPTSNRIIPSGQDLFVQRINDKFYIKDFRIGFGAYLTGLKIGDEIVRFNGKSVVAQIDQFLPKAVKGHSPKMFEYAINMLFAGTHDVKREITVNRSGELFNFYPDETLLSAKTNLIETKILNGQEVWLKVPRKTQFKGKVFVIHYVGNKNWFSNSN